MKRILLAATALAAATTAHAGTETVSLYDDQAFPTANMSAPYGGVSIESTQGFNGLSHGGKSFGTNLIRMSGEGNHTAGSSTLNFALGGLQAHTSISLDFLLAAIDSLDGHNPTYGPDQLTISVDGTQIFSSNYANCTGQAQDAPISNRFAGPADYGFTQSGPCYFDSAYDMGMLSAFQNIAHSGSTLLLSFVVTGLQAKSDESYGIDALSVTLNGTEDVPEPAMLGLFGLGAVGLGLARRRRA